MKPKGERWTVAVDFDGVIHSYESPWRGHQCIDDEPVPGAIDALNRLVEDFEVVIFTTRGGIPEGRSAVSAYIERHGGPADLVVTDKKPAALVYIDDRGYRFTGDNWPTAQDIHERLRPWNKQKEGAEPTDDVPHIRVPRDLVDAVADLVRRAKNPQRIEYFAESEEGHAILSELASLGVPK